MFAALLGYNPMPGPCWRHPAYLSRLPAHNAAVLTGRQFFPHLISAPFHHGLVIVFTAAAIMSVTGALVSLLRGKQFYYDNQVPPVTGPAAKVANGAGLPSPARESAAISPAPARRDAEAAPGALTRPAKLAWRPAGSGTDFSNDVVLPAPTASRPRSAILRAVSTT